MHSITIPRSLKIILCTILLLACPIPQVYAQTYQPIDVAFPILNGKMKLRGIVSPAEGASPQSPILVLVSPPQAINRDYFGFFKALSDSLNRRGYTTFRYDNRSFSDTLHSAATLHEGRYTMHDAADDLHDAITFLKGDKRFSTHPIGIIGHSEGGSVAMIETSRNADVKLLLLLATTGVGGENLYYTQVTSRLTPFIAQLSPRESNLWKYVVHRNARVIATAPDDQMALSRLQKEYTELFQQHPSLIKSAFRNITQEQFVDEQTLPFKNDARLLAAIRFQPAQYLSNIRCPIFIAYAQNDALLNSIEHQAGLERAFLEQGHFDFRSVMIEGANHSFEDQKFYLPVYVSTSRKENKLQLGKAFSRLLERMTHWMLETSY